MAYTPNRRVAQVSITHADRRAAASDAYGRYVGSANGYANGAYANTSPNAGKIAPAINADGIVVDADGEIIKGGRRKDDIGSDVTMPAAIEPVVKQSDLNKMDVEQERRPGSVVVKQAELDKNGYTGTERRSANVGNIPERRAGGYQASAKYAYTGANRRVNDFGRVPNRRK